MHIVALDVSDGKGGTGNDDVQIVVDDTAPPSLLVSLSPSVLWPPNHKMVAISASREVVDLCDADPQVQLEFIGINESETRNTYDPAFDGSLENGITQNDIQGADLGTDDREFALRAERTGTGAGRTYTVIYTASDDSGNATSATSTVTVPHNQ
jgi:hypothetical protein